ncbi:dorsal-related immunity factor Dif-like [Sitodiplosis mosellana]|uniref:dorsal-related immunity factor Dif-like n=1 Tax=Sitodiplosis mosellana TaxID=263140 RepID=UPI00244504A1|nr:dorsal-related immunity factor Dif-like [Sitodiplosis mosellana]
MATNAPYLKIVEQPTGKSYRFRYESEGRNSGSIFGVNSTKDKQTYPTIELGNVTGKIGIRITCVTNSDNGTPKQHPHKLSIKMKNKLSGEVLLKYNVTQKETIKIRDVGVVFVKKCRIQESLMLRMNANIDPTGGGWDYIERPHLFELHCVRLCFEAFLYNGADTDEDNVVPIGYVLSDPIMDKRYTGSLKIVEMSSTRSSASGGEKMIILCSKVKLEDISVLFYEKDADGKVIWKEEINHKTSEFMKLHYQLAITLRTPKYRDLNIEGARKVFVQLMRPSDNEYSEPQSFAFVANAQSMYNFDEDCGQKSKRKKPNGIMPENNQHAHHNQINTIVSPPKIKNDHHHVVTNDNQPNVTMAENERGSKPAANKSPNNRSVYEIHISKCENTVTSTDITEHITEHTKATLDLFEVEQLKSSNITDPHVCFKISTCSKQIYDEIMNEDLWAPRFCAREFRLSDQTKASNEKHSIRSILNESYGEQPHWKRCIINKYSMDFYCHSKLNFETENVIC